MILRTRNFFESVGVPTRMSAYDVSAATIPVISDRLKNRGRVALGERQDINPQVVQQILTLSVYTTQKSALRRGR